MPPEPQDLTTTDCDVDVLTFVVDHASYYFIATDGRRADIIRCETFQPGIEDEHDYFFYMWVKATQGYFVLKQRFLESTDLDAMVTILEDKMGYWT